MDRICSRMGESRGACRVLVRKPDEGDHLQDTGLDGEIILKWILQKWDGGTDWIDLAQDRDRRRALLNAVMNFRVS
jgi:hypothetical protein